MTITTAQITVRIPVDLVAFIDEQEGSRAAAVTRALRHEQRKLAAERDAMIYATTEPDPEMQALAQWASQNVVPIDDDL